MGINQEIANKLNEIADLLETQKANPFRVTAYRHAAQQILGLSKPASDIVAREGFEGLVALPEIGEGIARSIYEYVAMGRMSRLESLHGGHDPIALFESIPGIGPKLAHRIVEHLHIDTLEALEVAAHNNRLAQVPGFSRKRIELVQLWLEKTLGQSRGKRHLDETLDEPSIELILSMDKRYREKADADELPKIAPKRFNPEGKEWLPVMHATKQGWHFTALFSNTARAHQFHRTHDWVVIFFYDDQHHEGQHTVVSETRGPLKGKRIVRGRELECMDYYAE